MRDSEVDQPLARHLLAQAITDWLNIQPVGWIELVEIVETAPLADNCQQCEDDGGNPMRWPHDTEREGHWVTGYYRCHVCKHRWTCDWPADQLNPPFTWDI